MEENAEIINLWVATIPAVTYQRIRNDVATHPMFAPLRAHLRLTEGDVEPVGDFYVWLALVEMSLLRTVGIGMLSMADHPYRDWFSDGMSAPDAAREVIHSEDEEASFFSLRNTD